LWHVAEMVPKRHFDWATGEWGRQANFGQRRTIPPGSLVHESAWERRDNYKARLPRDAVLVSTRHSAP
jgi:hypothetical protein